MADMKRMRHTPDHRWHAAGMLGTFLHFRIEESGSDAWLFGVFISVVFSDPVLGLQKNDSGICMVTCKNGIREWIVPR